MCYSLAAICFLSSVALTGKKKQSRTVGGLQQGEPSNRICQPGERGSCLFPAPGSTRTPSQQGREGSCLLFSCMETWKWITIFLGDCHLQWPLHDLSGWPK